MSSYLSHRYKDVVLALFNSAKFGESLGKIQLQKYVYLIDILSVMADVIAPVDGHKTYKHGPFDKEIQNSVDALAFRGFIKISPVDMAVNYSLSNAGEELAQSIAQHDLFKKRRELYELVAEEVNKRGWSNLKAMVYSDPTFMNKRIDGWGYRFVYDSLRESETLRVLKGFEKMQRNKEGISKKNTVSIFFKLLC